MWPNTKGCETILFNYMFNYTFLKEKKCWFNIRRLISIFSLSECIYLLFEIEKYVWRQRIYIPKKKNQRNIPNDYYVYKIHIRLLLLLDKCNYISIWVTNKVTLCYSFLLQFLVLAKNNVFIIIIFNNDNYWIRIVLVMFSCEIIFCVVSL